MSRTNFLHSGFPQRSRPTAGSAHVRAQPPDEYALASFESFRQFPFKW